MTTTELFWLVCVSIGAGHCSALVIWDLWVRHWMPAPRNHIEPWKRKLQRDWQRNPLPAPSPDLIRTEEAC